MTPEQAARLRAPLDPADIDKLPKPYRKDADKSNCPECGQYHGLPALHIDYAGHAVVTDRLIQVDPDWTWEPVPDPSSAGLPTAPGGMWIKLTIAGVTRLGYGDADGKSGGNAVKETIGDAIRNAAMRFGVGLDLWKKEDKGRHGETDEPARARPGGRSTNQPAPTPTDTDEDWLNGIDLSIDAATDETTLKAIWDTVDGEHKAGRVAEADRAKLSQAITRKLQTIRQPQAGAA